MAVEFVSVVKPNEGLTSNGIAVDLNTGWVYVRHADGQNWTSGAKLTPMTLRMLQNYPPPTTPDPHK